jgi:hypothetical protein
MPCSRQLSRNADHRYLSPLGVRPRDKTYLKFQRRRKNNLLFSLQMRRYRIVYYRTRLKLVWACCYCGHAPQSLYRDRCRHCGHIRCRRCGFIGSSGRVNKIYSGETGSNHRGMDDDDEPVCLQSHGKRNDACSIASTFGLGRAPFSDASSIL